MYDIFAMYDIKTQTSWIVLPNNSLTHQNNIFDVLQQEISLDAVVVDVVVT